MRYGAVLFMAFAAADIAGSEAQALPTEISHSSEAVCVGMGPIGELAELRARGAYDEAVAAMLRYESTRVCILGTVVGGKLAVSVDGSAAFCFANLRSADGDRTWYYAPRPNEPRC